MCANLEGQLYCGVPVIYIDLVLGEVPVQHIGVFEAQASSDPLEQQATCVLSKAI